MEALATAVKEVYFQDYNTAYEGHTEIDKLRLLIKVGTMDY
jgi:hypothetical protein